MVHQRHRQRLATAWSFLILLLCTLPSKSLPQAPEMGLDKIAHFILFAIWGGLWLWTYPKQWQKIALTGLAFGLFTEVAQAALSKIFGIERFADWADALADGIGVGFALAYHHWVYKYCRK